MHIKHGLSKHLLYKIWTSMKTRCYNSNSRDYKYYGGRGITVCKRWRDDFRNFVKDMGEKPAGTTLDRIDNNGIYCRKNCRWISRAVNNANRRPKFNISEWDEPPVNRFTYARLVIEVDEDFHAKVKRRATERNITIRKWVVRAIDQALKREALGD